MKNALKKMLDFMLSFIQPKKMIRYRNINLFLTILIFLGCMFLCAGVSNVSLVNYVKRHKENFRLFPEVYDLECNEKVSLPKFTIDEQTGGLTNFTIGSEKDNVYEIKFNLENNKTLNLTLVYEPNVYVNDNEKTPHDDRLMSFDLNGYYNYQPKRDADGNLLEQDMLIVIHNELIYYMFNHGIDLIPDASGNYNRYLESTGWDIMESKYVLPKDATEIAYTGENNSELDYSKWTTVAKRGEQVVIGEKTYTAHATGERAYYLPASADELVLNAYGEYDVRKWTKLAENKEEKTFIDGKEYLAASRLNQNLHEIYVSNTTTRVGVFSLSQAKQYGIDFGNLENGKYPVDPTIAVVGIANLMVNSGSNQLQMYNFFYALIFILFMPLIWTFATWAMGKKFGELTRFKEYYAICSVSFIVPSIIIALFTIFVEPYAFIAQYAMFAQVAFYIFCIFKMNNVNKKPVKNNPNQDNSKPKKEEVIDLEVKTEKVEEKISRTAQME